MKRGSAGGATGTKADACFRDFCIHLISCSFPRQRTFLALIFAGAMLAQAQSQFVSESNLLDAVLERRTFTAVEQLALDLNDDDVVDVADLVYHLIFTSHIAPSVAFESFTSRAFEGDTTIVVPLVFSKALPAPLSVTYTVSGTAAVGAEGDCTIVGLNGGMGSIAVEAGETGAAIEILVRDDAVFGEEVETLQLTLSGGGPDTYYLGALQTHLIYLDDNDGVWTAGVELNEGGYVGLSIELTQYEGVYTGRIVSNHGAIPMPEAGDANRSGEDGWRAEIAASGNALRIEVGPIPLAPSLSFFAIHYNRYLVLEVKPGLSNYAFDPNRVFAGTARQVLEPVRSRLGAAWTERQYLRRESEGTFGMMRQSRDIMSKEATLAAAR